jgi:ribosome-associated heat shock protein Hsp15
MSALIMTQIINTERHRIDHWLKLVCLFKHRGDATDACRGGQVKLNGQRIKPSTPVKAGDVIEFLQGERPRRVIVSGLPGANVSKEIARTMYVDESPAWEPRAAMPGLATRERGAGRPTKRERRDIDKARRG